MITKLRFFLYFQSNVTFLEWIPEGKYFRNRRAFKGKLFTLRAERSPTGSSSRRNPCPLPPSSIFLLQNGRPSSWNFRYSSFIHIYIESLLVTYTISEILSTIIIFNHSTFPYRNASAISRSRAMMPSLPRTL